MEMVNWRKAITSRPLRHIYIKPCIILPPLLLYGQTSIFSISTPSCIDICVHNEYKNYKMFNRLLSVLRIMTIIFFWFSNASFIFFIFHIFLDFTFSHLLYSTYSYRFERIVKIFIVICANAFCNAHLPYYARFLHVREDAKKFSFLNGRAIKEKRTFFETFFLFCCHLKIKIILL